MTVISTASRDLDLCSDIADDLCFRHSNFSLLILFGLLSCNVFAEDNSCYIFVVKRHAVLLFSWMSASQVLCYKPNNTGFKLSCRIYLFPFNFINFFICKN